MIGQSDGFIVSESVRQYGPHHMTSTDVGPNASIVLQDNANNVLGIDPDVRQLVYTQAVANGGQGSYDIMKNLYLGVSGLVIKDPCPPP